MQLGVSAKAGNTRSIGAGLVARGSRRTGPARISGEVSGAYARSQIEIATDTNGVPGIGASEIRKVSQTSSEAWELRLRLDRYLGEKNSVYVAAAADGDRPSGRRVHAGGQVGYARALALSPLQVLTVELGYDMSHEEFVTAEPSRTSQSARAFAGYQLTPLAYVELRSSMDLLANVAPEPGPQGTIRPLHHSRAIGRVEADVKITGAAGIGVRIRTRFDSVPPPLPPIGGTEFEAGFTPASERFDTTAELVFLYTFP